MTQKAKVTLRSTMNAINAAAIELAGRSWLWHMKLDSESVRYNVIPIPIEEEEERVL